MVDENANICDECGHEGPEDTCPQCGGDMVPLEDESEEEAEDEEEGAGEEVEEEDLNGGEGDEEEGSDF